ncbi:hypothetical protein [Cytobacillus firmus]|uniref:hypothetical protein n=1 Tax=Cytobacillus firmus TaxID=1399 RepID=UPI00222829AE|nr:hypothetical protein [Cytobacillus firmus]
MNENEIKAIAECTRVKWHMKYRNQSRVGNQVRIDFNSDIVAENVEFQETITE